MTLASSPPGARSPLLEIVDADLGPPRRSSPVLTGVGLRLDRGEVGVLLGGNGAGKTTLLRTAAGLWPPRGGWLRSPREDGGFDPRRVALVLDDPASQFVGATVAGELEFALENAGLPHEEILARRDAALAAFALEPLRDRDATRLSPGEQARCLLAAALILRPSLLLLDDPFLYLGPGETRPVWSRLRGEVSAGRVGAVLLAAHEAELAVEADRVGVLEGGRLRAWGEPEKVLRGPLPEAVEPPLGTWLEERLQDRGFRLPPGGLDVDSMARRILAAEAG